MRLRGEERTSTPQRDQSPEDSLESEPTVTDRGRAVPRRPRVRRTDAERRRVRNQVPDRGPRSISASAQYSDTLLAEDAYRPLPTLVEAARLLFRRHKAWAVPRVRAATEPAVERCQDPQPIHVEDRRLPRASDPGTRRLCRVCPAVTRARRDASFPDSSGIPLVDDVAVLDSCREAIGCHRFDSSNQLERDAPSGMERVLVSGLLGEGAATR